MPALVVSEVYSHSQGAPVFYSILFDLLGDPEETGESGDPLILQHVPSIISDIASGILADGYAIILAQSDVDGGADQQFAVLRTKQDVMAALNRLRSSIGREEHLNYYPVTGWGLKSPIIKDLKELVISWPEIEDQLKDFGLFVRKGGIRFDIFPSSLTVNAGPAILAILKARAKEIVKELQLPVRWHED